MECLRTRYRAGYRIDLQLSLLIKEERSSQIIITSATWDALDAYTEEIQLEFIIY